MAKTLLMFCILLSIALAASTQPYSLYYKRGHRTIERFYAGSSITFMGLDGDWHQGEITRLVPDTLFYRTVVVRYYLMGSDTSRGPVQAVPLLFIKGMAKAGMRIQYSSNGSFAKNRRAGNRILSFVRDGKIFRIGGGGYAALYMINGGLSQKGPVWETHKPLIIAGGVFTAGMLMLIKQKDWRRLNGKYRLLIQ